MSSRVAYYIASFVVILTHTMIFSVKGQSTVQSCENGDPSNSVVAEQNVEAIRHLNEQVQSMRKLLTESLQQMKSQQDTIAESLQEVVRLFLDHDVSKKNQTLNPWELSIEVRRDLGEGPVLLPTLNNWIVIMQRFDGSLNFYRNWIEYRNGFGDIRRGEFWLGNEKVHRLTNGSGLVYHLKIEVEANGTWYDANYATFSLDSEDNKYAIRLSDFQGNAGDSLTNTAVDSKWNHGGMSFSTWDNDNDRATTNNCAQQYRAGYWFNNCWNSCLTCPYGKNFAWESLNHMPSRGILQAVRMKIKSK